MMLATPPAAPAIVAMEPVEAVPAERQASECGTMISLATWARQTPVSFEEAARMGDCLFIGLLTFNNGSFTSCE